MSVAVFVGALAACSKAPPAVLVLSPSQALAFGSVVKGEAQTATLTVANTGQTEATELAPGTGSLGDFAFSGGSYPGTTGTCGTSLAVAASCTIDLAFTPTNAVSESTTLTVQFFDGSVAQSVSEQLTGTGTAPAPVVTTSNFDPSVYTPADAGVGQTVDALGTVKTGVTGSSPILHATKAAADDALIIIALSNAAQDYVLVDQVINPNGTTISSVHYFDSKGDYTAAEINRAFPSQGAQAMMIPQSPDFASATGPGQYSFTITAIDTAGAGVTGVSADVYVVHQPVVTEPHVSVNMFFSGSAGLSAATAQAAVASSTANSFKSVMTTFVDTWGERAPCTGTTSATSLGLCIDAINYFDLPPGYGDVSGDFSEDTANKKDLVEVFEQSAGHAAGVNFFFLNEITIDGVSSSSGAERLLGVDGNIPSPGAFMGTPRSGAAIVLDTLPATAADQQRVGSTIAHEGGHYLGLFHVQEADCAPDNLADTPCDGNCVTNATDHHRASTVACTATTADTNENMMFWASTQDFQQLNFTAEQAATIRRHPLVH